MGQHLVRRRLLHVENLALQRQDGLEAAVAPLLGRAAGGLALHQVQLAILGVPLRAVGQLAGQVAHVHGVLAQHQVSSLARRLPRPRRGEALIDDALGVRRVLIEIHRQAVGHRGLHVPLDLRVAQLGLGLPLELGLGYLDADDGH